MIDQLKLLEIISLAVATGLIARFVGKWRVRHLDIDRFRCQCDMRFSSSVLNNDYLPRRTRVQLQAAYQESRIPYITLLLSSRPLNPVNWYDQEQLDAFFN